MKDHDTAVRHSSESTEHYTPAFIVEAARQTMGGIDLDPASCSEANAWIQAGMWLGREDDGFKRRWHGRVLLNPPGGLSDDMQRPVKPKCRETGSCGLPIGHTHTGTEASQKKWWFKLAQEYVSGRVKSAIFVCFSIELLQNTQVNTPDGEDGKPLFLPLDFPICFPSRRVSYIKPGGEAGAQPPHASCIIFLPPDADVRYPTSQVRKGMGDRPFVEAFSSVGRVISPSPRTFQR
jgi:hypothetical protein